AACVTRRCPGAALLCSGGFLLAEPLQLATDRIHPIVQRLRSCQLVGEFRGLAIAARRRLEFVSYFVKRARHLLLLVRPHPRPPPASCGAAPRKSSLHFAFRSASRCSVSPRAASPAAACFRPSCSRLVRSARRSSSPARRRIVSFDPSPCWPDFASSDAT